MNILTAVTPGKFVAAASAVTMTLVLTGCGEVGQKDSGTPTVKDYSVVEQHANEVFLLLTGNATQREATHYLQFRDANDGFEKCMAASGFPVQLEFLPIWTGYEPNATSGAWMGELGRRPSVMALQNAKSAQAEVEPLDPGSVEASPEYQREMQRCRGEDEAVIDFGNERGVPEGSTELTGEFKEMIFSIDAKLGSIDPYTECMRQAGIDLAAGPDGDSGWQGLYNFLIGSMPLPPSEGDQGASDWQQYLELESQAIEADTKCRELKYHAGLELLEPELADFVAAHQTELDRFAEEWPQAVATARGLGFDG